MPHYILTTMIGDHYLIHDDVNVIAHDHCEFTVHELNTPHTIEVFASDTLLQTRVTELALIPLPDEE